MNRWQTILAASVIAATPSAASAEDQFKVLVLAMPSTYHYEYIPIARDSLERMARQHAFALTWTDRPDAFDADLSQYAAVMFLNTPPEKLSAPQRARFEDYMRHGGNAVVVHRAAIVPPNEWPWFEKMVGRSFVNHPKLQTAVVTTADAGFPATFGLPPRWIWSDEYYVTTNPYRVSIDTVLQVDETSYDPTLIWPGQVGRPMGADHPEAWHHPYEKGRVFVTLLGHNADDYRDPQYLSHLLGGIYWTATGRGQKR